VDGDTARQIWDMMLSFDGYSFCKPHSASYAMVSFQSAYLRVHHPAEFMAAVLSNQGGYYRPHAYIAECRRMGLLTEGPDINASRGKYYGRGRRVIIGLMAVKGLSKSGAETVVAERERGGEFRSLGDFSRRVRLGRDDITALCPAGVFDGISGGLSRTMQARELLKSNTGTKGKGQGQEELFVAEPPAGYPRNRTTGILAGSKKKINPDELWEEYNTLGFLRNVHPLALWKEKIAALKRIKAIWLPQYVGSNVKLIGWPITQKEVWTKDGLTMSFLSFEDETGMYETVIFPQVYDKYHTLLFDQRPLIVYGKAVDDHGALTVEVRKIEVLGEKTVGPSLAAYYR
jgi:DNA polymerase-3 subunit alpha/error-prone DNA polymerase